MGKRSFTPASPADDGEKTVLVRAADGAVLEFATSEQNPSLGRKMLNRTADPLDVYYHRNQISRTQWLNGDWFRAMHYAAYGSGFAAVNLEGIHGVASYADNWRFTTKQANALKTITDYMAEIQRDEAHVLERVVFWGEWAQHAAVRRDMSRRGVRKDRIGIVLLRAALDRIDDLRRNGLPKGFHEAHQEG